MSRQSLFLLLVCTILSLSLSFNANGGSLDDLLTKENKTDEQTSKVITKKEYFNRIQNEIMKWMTKPRKTDSLKYMYQDVRRLPIKYANSHDKQKMLELNSILQKEYHMDGNFWWPGIKGQFDFGRLNRNLSYLSQYYGMKFVKDYLTKVGYEDKGLEKYSERQRKHRSTFARLDKSIKRNLGQFKKGMRAYKSKPETQPIRDFISDYNDFLVETYKIAMAKLFQVQDKYAGARGKLKEEYQHLLAEQYTGIRPKKLCIDLIISGLQQSSFSTEFNRAGCKYLDSYYYSSQHKCDIKATLEFIVKHPVTATEMILPLKNRTVDEIMDTVEPIRQSAQAALSGCEFSSK